MAETKKLILSFEDILRLFETNLDLIQSLNRFKKVVVVTRGGLCVAGILSQYLETRYYDTVCMTSYSDDRKQRKLDILKMNATEEEVLLVEDMVDTGDSLIHLKKYFPNAKCFAIHVKPKIAKLKPDYYLAEADEWVVYPWERG